MKKLTLTLLGLALATSVFGQGQIQFSTKIGGTATAASPGAVWAPVYLPEPGSPTVQKYGNTSSGVIAGTQTYSGGFVVGTGFTAALYGGALGTAAESLTLVSTTTFKTTTAAVFVGTVTQPNPAPTVQGVADGQRATFQIRVWENKGTITSWSQVAAAAAADPTLRFGVSLPFSPPFGLTVSPNPTVVNLQGLESFSLQVVPEPSAIALGVLGVGALVLFRRRKN